MVRFRGGPVCAKWPCCPLFWVDLLVRVARLVLLLWFRESDKFGKSGEQVRQVMQVKQIGHGLGGFGASACHLRSL